MRIPVALLLSLAVLAPGCAKDSGSSSDGVRLDVVTAVAPLTYLATQIGGSHVTVVDLAPAGEPHEIELNPSQVGQVAQADLVLRVPGFQPALDDAAPAAATPDLFKGWTEKSPMDDPHFWLDPLLFRHVATRIGEELAARDKAHQAEYTKNATTLSLQLVALHAKNRKDLTDCKSKDLVTSHAAFGHFAYRYFLRQVGIASVDDEAEPSPRRIADAVEFVLRNKITTIFAETKQSKPAQTVARETKTKVVVLDTLEKLRGDYVTAMAANVATLHKALRCA